MKVFLTVLWLGSIASGIFIGSLIMEKEGMHHAPAPTPEESAVVDIADHIIGGEPTNPELWEVLRKVDRLERKVDELDLILFQLMEETK